MKIYKLYIYELHSSDNLGSGGFEYGKSKVGIISESDEMTLGVLEEKYDFGDFWGDVEEFEQRDEDGGHKHLKLLKVANVDPLWVSKLGVGNLHEFDDALLKTYQIFEATTTTGLAKEQENFLNRYTKGTWSYDSVTGLVDVKGDFDCHGEDLVNFKGVKFGKVGGVFVCYANSLSSLAGAPQKVGEGFDCRRNRLTSLAGAPQEVEGEFWCGSNRFTSLVGAPQKVGGDFWCSSNRLESLVGAPQKIAGKFECDAFTLKEGQWNPRGWLKVLQEGNSVAQSLILTLMSSEVLNVEITKDPTGMILMPILLDTKEFVKQLSELENSKLDELIKEIEGLKKNNEVRIESSNLYTFIGPKSNEEEAKRIIAEMENEMKSEYEQALENSGESAAMDARDNVYFENGYKEILSKIGFEMED